MPTVRRARPAAPLLAGLAAGVVLAGLALVPSAAPEPPPAAAPAAATSPTPTPAPEPCADALAGLTPRERLAQRLVVGVDAADPQGVADLVAVTGVGGIFLPGNATALLTDGALDRVQEAAAIPVAVAVDDEGGRVQRIDTLDGELPSARTMAAAFTPQQVRELGRERGRALAARGVTVNYAPTVDLGGQPAGAVIGDRAFADDPDTVTAYAGAFAEGQRESGLLTVVKHFPGHGRADGDSHAGRVSTPPLDELRRADLRPYAALVGPGGPLADGRTAVMVGHLDVPGLTGALPATLTPQVYALLRDEIGFTGLVVTDDLGAMKAITAAFALPEAVTRALAAGADQALWSDGGRVGPVLDALERALSSGALDAAANDRAVARVLASKGLC